MRDLHTHSTYSDGKASPEEVILAAIDKGLSEIGLSDHSYTFFDESYCMKKERVEAYKAELAALKAKYAGKISVLCGVEQDAYSTESTAGFDYVIGSVHYIKVEGEYIPVDESIEILRAAVQKYFDGDVYALCEAYFATVADVVNKTDCDIIGHFDLISKFIEKEPLFDTQHPRYAAAWQKAVDELLKHNVPFEINTGAISRGYRTQPYPGEEMREYIREKGGRFVLSSDAHSKENIGYCFDEFEALV